MLAVAPHDIRSFGERRRSGRDFPMLLLVDRDMLLGGHLNSFRKQDEECDS